MYFFNTLKLKFSLINFIIIIRFITVVIYFNRIKIAAKTIDNAKKILFDVKLAEKLQLSLVQHEVPVPNTKSVATHISIQPLVQTSKAQVFYKKIDLFNQKLLKSCLR